MNSTNSAARAPGRSAGAVPRSNRTCVGKSQMLRSVSTCCGYETPRRGVLNRRFGRATVMRFAVCSLDGGPGARYTAGSMTRP